MRGDPVAVRMVLLFIVLVRYLFQKEVGFPFLLFYMNVTIFSDFLYQGADIPFPAVSGVSHTTCTLLRLR
ncbi:MAG: hypothetical protein ACLRTA_06805 [Clostridia bacterium]